MAVVFSNNAATTLAAGVSSSATSLTVNNGASFPDVSSASDHSYITLEDIDSNREVVKLTNRSGNTLTVVRAQDGTTARSFTIGDKVELRITAILLNEVAAQADTDTNTEYTAGSGLNLSGTTFTNTAPDQTVSISGSGATTVSGTYPNFTVSSTDTNTDTNTTYTAGSGLSLTGTTFANTAPDQTVSLTGSGATTISGTYPNFTISSTDSVDGGNADTVDSLHASSFLRSDASDTYTSGTLTFGSGTSFDLASNDVYAALRVIRNNGGITDGMYIGYGNSGTGPTRIFGGGTTSGGIRVNGSGNNDIVMGSSSGTAWHSANDGSGSGLDADLLDGQQGSYYLNYDNLSNKPTSIANADTVDNLHAASFARSDASDTIGNGVQWNWASTNTAGLKFTNSSYGKSLEIGGWTNTNSAGISRIRNSDDNLHIDSGGNGNLYLNHYSGGTVHANSHRVWSDGYVGTYDYNDLSNRPTIPSLSGYATETYVGNQITALVDSSPAHLDTLGELATAIGNNASGVTALTNSIATKWTQDNTKISQWDTAYSWGNHASAGYLTSYSETDTLATVTARGNSTSSDIDLNSANILIDSGKGFSNSGSWTRNTTPYGYIEFGPANTSWAHIYTDRNNFYFNRDLYAYNNLMWHAGNDGSNSGLDADYFDGVDSPVFFKSPSNASGWQNGNANFSVRSGGSAVGLHMEESDGTFGFQLYGDGPYYGFLDGEWGSWDLRKLTNGAFLVDEGAGLKRVLNEANWSSYISVPSVGNGTLTINTSGSASGGGTFTANQSGNTTINISATDTTANQTITLSGHAVGSGTTSIPVTVEYVDSKLDANNVNLNNPPNFPASGSRGVVGFYNAYFPTGSGNISNYNAPLDGGQHYHIQQFNGYSATDGSWSYQIAHSFYNSGMFHRNQNNGTWQAWRTLWDSLNDGSGSGLDADLLDGQEGSYYFQQSTPNQEEAYHLDVRDSRSAMVTPDGEDDFRVSAHFTNKIPNYTDWRSAITVKGWSDGYYAWQIHGPSSTGNPNSGLYYRDGKGSTWNSSYEIWHAGRDGSNSGLDADYLDGLDLHTGRNNEANKVVRTNSSGYAEFGWINTTSGATTSTINRIYASDDGYIRYYTPANFGSQISQHINYNNIANKPTIPSVGNGTLTINTSGSASGGGTFTANQSGNTTISLSATNTTYNFSGSQFTSRNSGNPIAIDSVVDNMVGYVNSSTAAGYSDGAGFSAAYSSSWVGQLFVDFRTGKLSTRGKNNGTWQSHRFMWDNLNDGASSGLDADTVDGYHGSNYLGKNGASYYRPNTWIDFNTTNAGLYWSGGIATGWHIYPENTTNMRVRSGASTAVGLKLQNTTATTYGSVYANSSYYIGFLDNSSNWALQVRNNGTIYRGNGTGLIWDSANDGSGSGLDADLLDGQHGSYYRPVSQATTLTGPVTGSGTTSISTLNPYQTSTTFQGSNGNSPDSAMEYQQTASLSDTKLVPSGDWYNSIRLGHGDPYNYYSNTIAIKMTGTQVGTLYTQTISNNTAQGWNKHWHNNNDGASSGLDADLLDGQHGSYYAPASTVPTVHNGTLTVQGAGSVSGSGTFTANSSGNATITLTGATIPSSLPANGGNADTLDGFNSSQSGGADRVLVTQSNGYLTVGNWIYGADNTGLYFPSGLHVNESNGRWRSSGGFTAGSTQVIDSAGHATFPTMRVVSSGAQIATPNAATNANIAVQSMSTDVGLQGRASDGSVKFQLYGAGVNYGFLNQAWSTWDLKKTTLGALYLNNNSTYYLQPEATSNFYALNVGGSPVLTSYSETDTLQSVTNRGASTSAYTSFTGGAKIDGTNEARTLPSRWFANGSNDGDVDYYTHNYAKAHLGNTYKYTTSRPNITSDTNYWVGSMGWGGTDLNTIMSYGSGFWDSWSSPANRPSTVTTHWTGLNSMHYTASSTYHHGMQMAMGAGNPSHTYLRGWWANGGSGHGWQKIWTDGNDGSSSGLDADLLDGQHGSYYAPASSIPSVGNGTITIAAGTNMSGGGSFTANQAGNTTITLNSTASGGGSGTTTYVARINSQDWDNIAASNYGWTIATFTNKFVVIKEALLWFDQPATVTGSTPHGKFGGHINVRMRSSNFKPPASGGNYHNDGAFTFRQNELNNGNWWTVQSNGDSQRFMVGAPRDATAGDADMQQQLGYIGTANGTQELQVKLPAWMSATATQSFYCYFRITVEVVDPIQDMRNASGIITY